MAVRKTATGRIKKIIRRCCKVLMVNMGPNLFERDGRRSARAA